MTRRTRLQPAAAADLLARDYLLTRNAAPLQRWRAGRANRAYSPANVVCLGDSITEGQGATLMSRRYVAQLTNALRARYPTAGVTGGGRGFIGVTKTGESSFTWPTTLANSPTADQNYGPKRQAAILASAGQSVTFTLQGTSCDLMVAASSAAGIVSYTVDGGGASTYDCTTSNAGATPIGGILKRITLGASGAHTLVVSWSSGGSCYIEGVVEYDGDESAGIHVHDAGHYGWNTTQWANRNGFVYWMHSIGALNPDLLILAVNTNDPVSSIAPATTLANLQSILGYLRGTLSQNPSVLAVPMFQRSDVGTAATWAGTVQAIKSLAVIDPMVSVCDLSTLMPAVGLGAPSLSLYSDLVHPNDKGHATMAEILLNAID